MEIIKQARLRLEEELHRIDHELRVDLPKEINVALAQGDLSENAEYEAAKERQSTLQARMGQIQKRLADLSRIDVKGIPKDRAGLGSEVTVENLETGDVVSYTLVIPEVADGKKNLVSVAAPVGKALLNRRVGDTVNVVIPKGNYEFEVQRIVTTFGDVME